MWIVFFAERNIASDCEIIETGVIMGKAVGLTLDNADIKAAAKSKHILYSLYKFIFLKKKSVLPAVLTGGALLCVSYISLRQNE